MEEMYILLGRAMRHPLTAGSIKNPHCAWILLVCVEGTLAGQGYVNVYMLELP